MPMLSSTQVRCEKWSVSTDLERHIKFHWVVKNKWAKPLSFRAIVLLHSSVYTEYGSGNLPVSRFSPDWMLSA
jgi:hypothetical protein